jgi:hypothetical protein
MNFEAWCKTRPRYEEVRDKMTEIIDQHDLDQIHLHIIRQTPEGQLKCIRELQDWAYDVACCEIDTEKEAKPNRKSGKAHRIIGLTIFGAIGIPLAAMGFPWLAVLPFLAMLALINELDNRLYPNPGRFRILRWVPEE